MTSRPILILATALALSPTIAGAQSTQSTTPAPAPSAASARGPDVLDPVALDALRGMGAYLKSLKAFELRSKATIETSLQDTDLQVHFGYEGTYRVQRPNAFFVQLTSDRAVREYIYDGKNFTVNVPRQGLYATVTAPPTIRQAVDRIYLDYGISLPLADLFYWADESSTDGIVSAVRVGYAKINGQEADQFAYRGADLDWQLWIARGKAPLPLRIVITSRAQEPRPSLSADLTWNTSPNFTARTFAFAPPANASAIKMATYSPEK